MADMMLSHKEQGHHAHRDRLARQVNGETERPLGYGHVDAATTDRVFEVKPYRGCAPYRELQKGAQQALAYSAESSLRPALAVYGIAQGGEPARILRRIGERHLPGLVGANRLELWWWTGSQWHHISDRSRWVNMPHGSKFRRCTLARLRRSQTAGRSHQAGKF